MTTSADIDRAASAVHPDPSPGQKMTGNYRKGHVTLHGLNIAIENPRGSERKGVGKDGEEWSVRMPSHYGYLKGTQGADGDHVDTYIGPHVKSPKAFVVDQIDPDSKDFDETKVMIGYANRNQATKHYTKSFSDDRGPERIGHMAEMDVGELKDWLRNGETTKPVGYRKGGVVGYADGGSAPGIFDQAQQQYPILKKHDIQYRENFGGDQSGNMLESWPPGETGTPDRPRPQEFNSDKLGVEVFDPKTRPIDVLGDVVSHHLVEADPKIRGYYDGFVNSLEPWQHERLQEQYQHAKENEGEARPFEDWKQSSGLPAYFRGYPFQQWSKSEDMYTPSQMKKLDRMMGYLKEPGPQSQPASGLTGWADSNDEADGVAAAQAAREAWADRTRKSVTKGFASGGAVDDWIVPGAAAPAAGAADDWTVPDASTAPDKPASPGFLSNMASAVTDIPHKIYEAGSQAVSGINEAFNPYSETQKAATIRKMERAKTNPFGGFGEDLESLKSTGSGLLSAPALALSPVTGAARSVIGHTVDALDPLTPEQTEKARKMGAHLPGGDEVADLSLSALAPGRGGIRPPVAVPPRPVGNGPLGVTLSEGQATGELPLIQREQAALRGQTGARSQAAAQEFRDQQAGQVAQAGEDVSRSMDPFGARVAETPQAAAEIAADTVRREAVTRKAGVTAAYNEAKALPGEIHADVFRDMGQSIKSDLSGRTDPIIIDELTPRASKAIDYIDGRIDQLKILNKADPNAPPIPDDILGVTLKGVDQWRKHLGALKNDAFSSGNATDGRAIQGVMKAFDDRLADAINSGAFRGDPRAVQAWNDARAAHADYKSTFGAQSKDPVGRVVEKVLGNRTNEASTPNAVADFLYGTTGINPSDLNLGVTNRFKKILGEQSPEWSGVKQGLFSRIVEPGGDLAAWGPKKVADRITKFLDVDGREMANSVYSTPERQMMRDYADLLRRLEVPQAGANWSNTGTAKVFQKIANHLGSGIGLILGSAGGHAVGLPWGVGEGLGLATAKGSKMLADRREAAVISRQMPILANQMRAWARAVDRANRANTPLSTRALNGAAINLNSTLNKLGTSLPNMVLQLPSTAGAEADQQQVPRPPAEHQDGGKIQNQQEFARGGHVRPAWHQARFG